jgi:2,4-dienoyl-CoA reductase-like NADH-dependent reductase (Old Yellow Enzyme family)/thioredoxin reductase
MRLSEPGAIGPLRLKNRVVMAPMGTNFGTTDGFATERDKRYYAERARGGVALIVTEAMNISAGARNHNNSLCVFHDAFIPGLRALVAAMHDHGALVVGQLNHRGQLLRRSVLGMEPVAPSSGSHPATGEPVRALRVDEIHRIQQDFLSAARRLARAGYDAVELHAANGYLFQQFFSPRFNHRSDEYGGSLENRMRLLLETTRLVRHELPDFPIIVRLSATEFVAGGYSDEELIELAQVLQDEGVAAIDLSGGSNESPELSRFCIQPPSFPRRCLAPYGRRMKEALRIPVIIAGRIVTPEDAEAVLQEGSADFVSLGRALIADPHWCAKALGDVDAPVRACISCNVCFERLSRERDVCCVQNPLVGTEFESLEFLEPQLAQRVESGSKRRLLVIGAGVSGVEAARVAAGLGYAVEIWDTAEAPGGQMPLALAAPDKADVEAVWTYRMEELRRLAVPIECGRRITADRIRTFAPDMAMIATGARPRELAIELPAEVRKIQAWDVLLNRQKVAPGAAVTIVGGGMVGIETADLLVARGCRVTLVEMRSSLAPEMARNNRFEILQRLDRGQARVLTDAHIEGFDGAELLVVHNSRRNGARGDVGGDVREDGERLRIDPGVAVILALGAVPNRDVVPTVEEAGVPYVLVGDCLQPGDFLTAIRDASMAVLALESCETA